MTNCKTIYTGNMSLRFCLDTEADFSESHKRYDVILSDYDSE